MRVLLELVLVELRMLWVWRVGGMVSDWIGVGLRKWLFFKFILRVKLVIEYKY